MVTFLPPLLSEKPGRPPLGCRRGEFRAAVGRPCVSATAVAGRCAIVAGNGTAASRYSRLNADDEP